MPQTNTKEGAVVLQDLTNGVNGVVHGGRVARAIGDKEAMWLKAVQLFIANVSREYLHVATPLGEVAQDVGFDPYIQYRNAIGGVGISIEVRLGSTNFGRKLQTFHWRTGVQLLLQLFFVVNLGGNNGIHRSLAPNVGHQSAGIDVPDGHDVVVAEKGIQRAYGLMAGVGTRKISDNQTGNFSGVALVLFGMHSIVADMGMGLDQNLPIVGRISENLLISSHAGVETQLTSGCSPLSYGYSAKKKPIFQKEIGWFFMDILHNLCMRRSVSVLPPGYTVPVDQKLVVKNIFFGLLLDFTLIFQRDGFKRNLFIVA